MTITELVKKIESLPQRQQEEVEEFVDFLASRHPVRSRRSAFGKYINVPASSDDFARRKSEEIELEDRKR